MTTVTVEKSTLGRKITVDGHTSDRACREGNIVCAAVSMLVQTIAQNVYDAEDTGNADIIDVTLKAGDSCISYIADDDSLNVAVDGICKGFLLLAENYPDKVCCIGEDY